MPWYCPLPLGDVLKCISNNCICIYVKRLQPSLAPLKRHGWEVTIVNHGGPKQHSLWKETFFPLCCRFKSIMRESEQLKVDILNPCVLALWCLTLCYPLDYRPPGSSVHGLLQARILDRIAICSSRGSSQPRDQTCVSLWLLHWQLGSLPLHHWIG